MGHYIDIQLRPDPEFPVHLLMSALYAKLHRGLVQLELNSVGVSFPGYQERPPRLGETLRLIGPQDALAQLMQHPWMQGMRDHVAVSALASVPEDAQYRRLHRVQVKSSPERLRRRQMRRHALTSAQALSRVSEAAVERVSLPFVMITSTSTSQTFPLFLALSPPTDALKPATVFNAYGLSGDGLIPWF